MACMTQSDVQVAIKHSDEPCCVNVSGFRNMPVESVQTETQHVCSFIDGGKHTEVGAVDVDTWMEIVAHNEGVSMCTRELYLAKIDSIWGVCAGVPYDNVSATTTCMHAQNVFLTLQKANTER